jgi:hypothetical protein
VNPQPIPSARRALVVARVALDLMPRATPLALHCAIFDADIAHADEYGRQIYGERWRVDWSGPRGCVIDGLLNRDPVTLSQIDEPDRRIICEIGFAQGGTVIDLQPAIDKMRMISNRRDETRTPTESLSESEYEVLSAACRAVPMGDRAILEHLVWHAAVRRSNGFQIEPCDMIDPTNPKHEERTRAIAETSACTFY